MGVKDFDGFYRRLDGRRFSSYKLLKGVIFDFDSFKASFTKIQSDPHAPPSIVEAVIPHSIHGFDNYFLKDGNLIPFTDYLVRRLYRLCRSVSAKCGSGYSGYIGIPKPGPWILKRSAVEVGESNDIIVRFYVGLPARGRRILGREFKRILCEKIPQVINTLIKLNDDELRDVRKHIELYQSQEYVRDWLYRNRYICFIADGSILPRESSISQKPLRNAVPFEAPRELRKSIRLPNGRVISGLAIPEGLTIISGGGYHGKTTLLRAIQDGIYNHTSGDGREYVISRSNTVFIKAEDGRLISHVDISSFIDNLPLNKDTRDFSSLNASGSTSMAASINEAVEAGAEVILLDEDTSATNLLYKDSVMSEIIRYDPIKPISSQIDSFIERTKISVVVIASSSSALLNKADRVIIMENYKPRCLIEGQYNSTTSSLNYEYKPPIKRVYKGIKMFKKVRTQGFKLIVKYSDNVDFELDLSNNLRIVEKGQVKFISYIISKIASVSKPIDIRSLVSYIDGLIDRYGFKVFIKPVPPDLTAVSGFDVVWVLNRLYNVLIKQCS